MSDDNIIRKLKYLISSTLANGNFDEETKFILETFDRSRIFVRDDLYNMEKSVIIIYKFPWSDEEYSRGHSISSADLYRSKYDYLELALKNIAFDFVKDIKNRLQEIRAPKFLNGLNPVNEEFSYWNSEIKERYRRGRGLDEIVKDSNDDSLVKSINSTREKYAKMEVEGLTKKKKKIADKLKEKAEEKIKKIESNSRAIDL